MRMRVQTQFYIRRNQCLYFLILVWLFPLDHVFVYLEIFHATIHSLHLSVISQYTDAPTTYLSPRSHRKYQKNFLENNNYCFVSPSFLSPLFRRCMHAVNDCLLTDHQHLRPGRVETVNCL